MWKPGTSITSALQNSIIPCPRPELLFKTSPVQLTGSHDTPQAAVQQIQLLRCNTRFLSPLPSAIFRWPFLLAGYPLAANLVPKWLEIFSISEFASAPFAMLLWSTHRSIQNTPTLRRALEFRSLVLGLTPPRVIGALDVVLSASVWKRFKYHPLPRHIKPV